MNATPSGNAPEAVPRPARVLVMWCPDWPVIASGADPDRPVAVVATGSSEAGGAVGTVIACSAAAREAGVGRGQRLRDAQRHCPELEIRHRDPAREIRAFEPVIALVESFAPAVEVMRPGVCAIGVRGPARYFGGEQELARLIRDAVGDLEPSSLPGVAIGLAALGCGVGIADGAFTALLAARSDTIVPAGAAREFLAPLPTAVLERPELARVLAGLGIRTLDEFAALASARVTERFGVEGAMAHRQARGLDPRPLAPRRAGVDLSASMAFDPPATRSDQVVFAAKALADEFHQRLAAAGVACVRVGIEVTSTGVEPARPSLRLWRHDGLLSSLAVAERVRWQLDGWRLDNAQPGNSRPGGRASRSPGRPFGSGSAPERDTDPLHGGDRGDDAAGDGIDDTGGVTGLRLYPDHVVIDQGRQLGLWGEDVVPDRVERAVDRIVTLAGDSLADGHDAVTRPLLVGGRSPAERVIRVSWGDIPSSSSHDGDWPGAIPPPAPAAVFDDPPRARLVDAAGELVTVDGRSLISARPALLVLGTVTLTITWWAGPWPALERWWDTDRRRRRAWLQCVTADQVAWLLVLESGDWRVAARY